MIEPVEVLVKTLVSVLVILVLVSMVVSCATPQMTAEQEAQEMSLLAKRDAAEEMGDFNSVMKYDMELEEFYAQVARDAAANSSWVQIALGFLPAPVKGVVGGLVTFLAPMLFTESRKSGINGFKRVVSAGNNILPWNFKVGMKDGTADFVAAATHFLDMWRGEWGELGLAKAPPA